ncbi:MAG: DUF3108 domain-containing protein [Candidatus Krumholzibacteriota bacterium]|nr:DUF3108 domain-containing protein [Candidatus Krumholzibacteriota bacterium]
MNSKDNTTCIPGSMFGWKRVAVTLLMSWFVLFSGRILADEEVEQDTVGGTKDHGIEKLEGFELVNPVPRVVPFGEGENLIFQIRYGLITAGRATMEIRNIALIDSIRAYHIVSVARTNSVFDKIFKVRDRHESFIDYDYLYSLRFEKHLREGKYRHDREITFDQKRHVAIYKNEEKPIPPNTRDVLAALYYVRTLDFEPGQAVSMANHTSGKNYPIYIKMIGREHVTVPAGEFDCVIIEPVLETSAIFENKGKLTIWLTDDTVRMPVMMRSKVIVGAFEAVLEEYQLSPDSIRVIEQRGIFQDGR